MPCITWHKFWYAGTLVCQAPSRRKLRNESFIIM